MSRIPRLFSDLADLWPLLSPVEYYVPEAESIHRVLFKHLKLENSRPSLLEMGAGGGHTIHHLTDRYQIVALDLSESMLENCRGLNPKVEAILDDMRTARLGRTFDAVLIHDSVDYLLDKKEVSEALETAAVHLEKGGIVLVAPTYVAETFVEHDTSTDHHSDGNTDLTYMSYVHRLENRENLVEAILVYLIRRDGKVETIEDRHMGGLFSTSEWSEMLWSAGFDVGMDYLIEPCDESGAGVPMFVGVKR